MKKLYLASSGLFAICTFAIAASYANAQSVNANANAAANANSNALNASDNSARASKPVFNSDGSPANDAALGIPLDPPVALPPKAAAKPHGRHEISLGPVEHKKYPSKPQQAVTSLR